MLTERFDAALTYAREVHAGDVRKGTATPYLAHLLGVASLVLEHGGDEDQAIAGLLHDTAEDHGGQARLDDVAARFGERVAAIVAACSDSLVEDRDAKAPWWPRKVAYLAALADEPADALVVSAADKLHNARALVADHRTHGDALWMRFNPDAGRRGQLWYQRRLQEVLRHRAESHDGALVALVDELGRTVDALWQDVIAVHGAASVEADWRSARDVEEQLRAGAEAGVQPV